VIDRAERVALLGAGTLMAVFLGALVYAATRLGIGVPSCVTDVAPFTEGAVIDKGNGRYEVHVVARMWAFDPPEVRLPPGSDVDLYVSALDVTHGVYVEGTNVNLMAVPGAVNAARVRFDREGEYGVVCHEYCGTGHQLMMGKFVIAPGAATAVSPRRPRAAVAPTSPGERLFAEKACDSCHTIDGSPGLGPTLKGVFGRRVELEDGSTRIADDAYLREAIREPEHEIVKGYADTMPEEHLPDDEVRALVEYLKTLS
jgi:cytochrome c oxidase subunit 2